MIDFTINGQEVQGQDGWTILEVARWHGIDIPTLCHHGAAGALRRLPPVRGGGGRRQTLPGGDLLHVPHQAGHQGADGNSPGGQCAPLDRPVAVGRKPGVAPDPGTGQDLWGDPLAASRRRGWILPATSAVCASGPARKWWACRPSPSATGAAQGDHQPLPRSQQGVPGVRQLRLCLSHGGHGTGVPPGQGRSPGRQKKENAMKTEGKIGIFLCECGGKISNRIEPAEGERTAQLRSLGAPRHLSVSCVLAPGLAAMKARSEGQRD